VSALQLAEVTWRRLAVDGARQILAGHRRQAVFTRGAYDALLKKNKVSCT
jgi:hypothetical protein